MIERGEQLGRHMLGGARKAEGLAELSRAAKLARQLAPAAQVRQWIGLVWFGLSAMAGARSTTLPCRNPPVFFS